MKTKTFNALLLGLSMSLVACSTDSLLDNSKSSGIQNISSDDFFDYSMTESVTFDVNYGNQFGSNTLMEVFTEDPLGTDAEPIRSDILPVYKGYTDSNGKFSGDITMPTYVQKVWLVNRAFCLPMVVEADVNNGYVEFENEDYSSSSNNSNELATRAGSSNEVSYNVTRIDNAADDKGYWCITEIENNYGSIRNSALVSSSTTLGANTVAPLQKTLWNGSTSKPNGLQNAKYAVSSDTINTVIKEFYLDDDGIKHTVEDAEISIVFLTEAGSYQSSLGYYYYKTGTNPNAKDVKKFVAIPNTSVAGGTPYVKGNLGSGNAPAYPGETVSLLYEYEDGKYTKSFPPGYTIGFFLIGNGYDYKNKKILTTVGNDSKGPFFSNEKWNTNSAKKFIAFSLPTKEIVYGVEDGGDQSYEDDLFIVQSNPNEKIENTLIHVINPEEGTITPVDEPTQRTYVFEDKFPYNKGCDYDMNDVIVGHQRNIKFDRINGLQTVTDAYTFKQEYGALDYKDAFAVQMNPSYLGSSLTITDGSGKDITSKVKVYEDTKHNNWKTYILCEDAKANTGETFTVTRVFNGSCTKAAFEKAEPVDKINPFVISQFTDGAYNNNTLTEVHFAGDDPMTSKGNPEYDNNGNQYYIGLAGEDNEYFPYALSIPQAEFTAPNPAQRIDKKYTYFKPWANSKGTKNTDWYKY